VTEQLESVKHWNDETQETIESEGHKIFETFEIHSKFTTIPHIFQKLK